MTAAVRHGSYGALAKTLHWLTVLLVVGQFIIMWSIPGGAAGGAPEVQWLWDLHASFGMTILIVTIIRFINRQMNPPPPYPADMPGIQVFAANAVHLLIYAALVAQPILGWLTLNAYSGPFTFYWLFDVPALTGIDPDLKRTAGGLHRLLALGILLLLAVHVAAALFHGIVKRDRVLSSMAR
jgi:cytochrome b561